LQVSTEAGTKSSNLADSFEAKQDIFSDACSQLISEKLIVCGYVLLQQGQQAVRRVADDNARAPGRAGDGGLQPVCPRGHGCAQ
jgi:hypothetical protein